jgi:hypothetical protein
LYYCGSTITFNESLAAAVRREPSPVSARPRRWETSGSAFTPASPVEAIFEEDAVPDKWKDYTPKNAAYYEKNK